jgi:uncharacterized protein YukE
MNKKGKKDTKDAIAEAKEKFLKTVKLDDIHYEDEPELFNLIIFYGIRPIRLLADSIDRIIEERGADEEGVALLLNEIQIKADNLIEHLERWYRECHKEYQEQLQEWRQKMSGNQEKDN